jgi:hypothetical protein
MRLLSLISPAVLAWGFLGLQPTAAFAATPTPCVLPFLSPRVLPISGDLRHVMVDSACQYIYIANASFNRIEVFSIADNALQAPIAVGSQPTGFDISGDGSTMYVANAGGNNLSVVDLALRQELRKITVAPNFSNDRPFSLAIANNGLALFTTTFAGSGFGARMMELNLSTEAVSQRTDFWFGGTTTEATYVSPSADRSTIAIVAGDISSGPVFRYASAANAFSPEKDLSAFVAYIATGPTGAPVLVNPGTYVLDSALNLQGTIPGGGLGVAVSPSAAVGYRVVSGGIEALDLTTLLPTGSLPLGDTVGGGAFYNGIGRMAISAHGTLLAVITDHGLSLVGAGAGAPPVEIQRAMFVNHSARLWVTATSSLDPGTALSLTVPGCLTEAPMTLVKQTYVFQDSVPTCGNLDGQTATVTSNLGGSDSETIR